MTKAHIRQQLIATGYPITAKYLNALYAMARKLSIKYMVPQDYADICQLALIEAVKMEAKFDSTKGSFATFIQKPVKHVVQRVYGHTKSSTSLYNKVRKFTEEYFKQHARYPSASNIQKSVGISEIALKSIYYGKPYKISLDNLNADLYLDNEETQINSQTERLLESLDNSARELVELYYFEDYTVEELSVIFKNPLADTNHQLTKALNVLKEAANVR